MAGVGAAAWVTPTNTDELSGPGRPLKILFLTPRPPDRCFQGYRIRAYHQLRILGRRHRITLISFADPRAAGPLPSACAEFCERVVIVPLSRRRMAVSLLRRSFSHVPLQSAIYAAPAMRRAIRDALTREAFDLVHVQLARMAPYLPDVASARRVVDLVDALSLNMERRYRHDRGLSRWVAYVESRRLRRYEQTICATADCAMVGSPADCRAIGSPARLATVTSGVDPREFPFRREGRENDTVIFSGNMRYFSNVHAVLWFSASVWPLLKRMVPAARFHVVGAWPARAVRRLAEQDPSITVSGLVEHVHPCLSRATLAVAPLWSGSGQQLKVLEAMASGTPVVATALAADSIEARHGEHLLVADDPEAFAQCIAHLLRDPAAADHLAENGRRFVEDRYTWEHAAAQLETIYRCVTGGGPVFPGPGGD